MKTVLHLPSDEKFSVTNTRHQIHSTLYRPILYVSQIKCQKWIYNAHPHKKNLQCARHTSTARTDGLMYLKTGFDVKPTSLDFGKTVTKKN